MCIGLMGIQAIHLLHQNQESFILFMKRGPCLNNNLNSINFKVKSIIFNSLEILAVLVKIIQIAGTLCSSSKINTINGNTLQF